jgi:hypothetical protein
MGRLRPLATITGTLELDLVKLRVPVVLAFGIGALAAGIAYPQGEAHLPNQPGGTGPNAEPGSSVTIVPMILLRNFGRNDGGGADGDHDAPGGSRSRPAGLFCFGRIEANEVRQLRR